MKARFVEAYRVPGDHEIKIDSRNGVWFNGCLSRVCATPAEARRYAHGLFRAVLIVSASHMKERLANAERALHRLGEDYLNLSHFSSLDGVRCPGSWS